MITEEHRMLRESVRAWAEKEIAPNAAQADRDAQFPKASWDAYVASGFVGMQYPEQYGGQGADGVSNAIMVEEMARVCASSALFALISKLSMFPVLGWGSEELKSKYVPEIAAGRSQGCYCLSEPGAGSDVGSMRTRAVKDGDTYVLNGVKVWITNAGVSDLYTVFAKTDPDAGSRGISAFLVEMDEGIKIGKLEEKLGIKGSPTGEVILEDVRVHESRRIGNEGDGFKIAMWTLDRSRPGIGAQALGIAQGAIDLAASYMKEREQFGKPIAEFQGLRFMLADMAMRTEAARQMVYRAMELADDDPHGELTVAGAMAKCLASDAAMSVTTDAVQLLGGNGYTKDFPAERFMRDAKITQIYEGTNQIQRVVISRELLK
jgi:alkylation response protein AidB-like acyl-CoA dehydrogenase